MLLRSVWRAALAATAFAPAIFAEDANPPGQSTFISPDNHVAFAFTVPEDKDNTYPGSTFFSIRVPNKYSWGAVGLGSDDMKGALFLMIYQNGDGNNVTFSPRIAHGNYEPVFFDEMRWTIVPNNTGIIDGYMVFTAMCTAQCRTWPGGDTTGGYIDISSPNQKGIFAVGPEETFKSDSASAALKFHSEYGVFTMDMGRTRGSADAPVLNKDSQNEGTSFDWRKTGQSDYKARLHATFMLFFIIGMMNFGVVLLRACGWAKWHALNQIVATMGVFAGLALGVLTSFLYTRSRSFKSYHQVLGYIIVAFILAQLGLGVKHHLEYRRTQAPTMFGRIHLWVGRLILLLAVVNAVIGFSFALNTTSAIIFVGLLIVGSAIALFLMYGRQRFFKKKQTFQPVGAQQPPPWRQSSNSYNAGYPSEPPPGYEPPSQQVGLQGAGSSSNNSPWRSADNKADEDEPQLGSVQRPREFA